MRLSAQLPTFHVIDDFRAFFNTYLHRHATTNLTLAAGLLYSDLYSNGNPAAQIRRGLKVNCSLHDVIIQSNK